MVWREQQNKKAEQEKTEETDVRTGRFLVLCFLCFLLFNFLQSSVPRMQTASVIARRSPKKLCRASIPQTWPMIIPVWRFHPLVPKPFKFAICILQFAIP